MPFLLTVRPLAGCVCLLLAATSCKSTDTNSPPVADAGVDQVSHVHREIGSNGQPVDVFDPVTLDGSSSSDPDSDHIVRYFWSFDTVPVGSHLDFAALAPNNGSTPRPSSRPIMKGPTDCCSRSSTGSGCRRATTSRCRWCATMASPPPTPEATSTGW